MTFDNAIGVLKDIKRIDPHILTVMGGPHVSFCARETLNACPQLDIIVLGEGERTIVELVLAARMTSAPGPASMALPIATVAKSALLKKENPSKIWMICRYPIADCCRWVATGHSGCPSA